MRVISDESLSFPQYPRLPLGVEFYTQPSGLGVYVRDSSVDFVIRGKDLEKPLEFIKSEYVGELSLWSGLESCQSNDSLASGVMTILWILFQRNLLLDGKCIAGEGDTEKSDLVRKRSIYFDSRLGLSEFNSGFAVGKRFENQKITVLCNGLIGALTTEFLSSSGLQLSQVFYADKPEVFEKCSQKQGVIYMRNLFEGNAKELFQPYAADLQTYVRGSALFLVVGTNIAPSIFEICSTMAAFERVPSLFANLSKSSFTVGPLADQHSSSCHVCSTLRDRSMNSIAVNTELFERYLNGKVHSVDQGISPISGMNSGETLPQSINLASIVVAETERILSGVATPPTLNGRLRADLTSGVVAREVVQRVPGCENCGAPKSSELIATKVFDRTKN